MRLVSLLALALLTLTTPAEVQPTDDAKDASIDASAAVKRRTSPVHKQLSYLLDENKRLKAEVEDITVKLETPEIRAHRQQVTEAAAKQAEENRRSAEAQAKAEERKAAALKYELEISEAQSTAAVANATALQAALEQARLALEVRKQEALAAAEERAKAEVDREKTRLMTSFAENQRVISEASARQWASISASAAANASLAQAQAERARALATVAEEQRRKAETEALLSSEAKHEARLKAALASEAEAARQQALEAALDSVRTAQRQADVWRNQSELLQAQLTDAQAALNATKAALRVQDVDAAVEQALQGANETLEAVKAAQRGYATDAAARAKEREEEQRHNKFVLEAAQSKVEVAQKELLAAVAQRDAAQAVHAAAVAESKRIADSIQETALQATRAKEEAISAEFRAKEAESKRATAAAEEAKAEALLQAAASRSAEAKAYANASTAALQRSEVERDTALAKAAQAQAEASEASSRLRLEEARVEASRVELVHAQARARQAEAAAREAEALVRQAEAHARSLQADITLAKERAKLAEAEASKARAEATIAESLVTQYDSLVKVAQANATAMGHSRAIAEAQLAAARSMAEMEASKLESKQAEVAIAKAQVEVAKAQEQVEVVRMQREREEHDKRLEAELKQKRALMQDEDELVRAREAQRVDSEERLARLRESERLAVEEKLTARRAEADAAVALAKAKAEAEGRVLEAERTADLRAKEAQAAATASRQRLLDGITAVLDGIGAGALALIKDHLQTVLAALATLMAAYFLAREGAILVRTELTRLLGQPTLVRETSLKRGPAGLLGRWAPTFAVQRSNPSDPFQGVVLSKDIEQKARVLAESTRNAHLNRAPLRHVLLYGPPGSGKTLLATALARHCGLDYAIMAGGDVAPLGAQAVAELNNIFAWAKTSPRGMLLFIDEAEAFLSSRTRGNAGRTMTEEARNALSALLAATGDPSPNLMLVLATNRPGDLDSAVVDRVDENMFLGAPDEEGRLALLSLYLDKYINTNTAEVLSKTQRPWFGRPAQRTLALASDVTPSFLASIAKQSVGLSGRAIAKVMVAAQAAAYGRPARAEDGACVVLKQYILDAIDAEMDKLNRRLGGTGSSPSPPLDRTLYSQGQGTGHAHGGGDRYASMQGKSIRSPTSLDAAHVFWGNGGVPLSHSTGTTVDTDPSSSFVVPGLGAEQAQHDGQQYGHVGKSGGSYGHQAQAQQHRRAVGTRQLMQSPVAQHRSTAATPGSGETPEQD